MAPAESTISRGGVGTMVRVATDIVDGDGPAASR